MKYFFLAAFLGITFPAFAAPRVNSGGGGWACRKNDGTGQVIWIKAADLTKVEYYSKRGLPEQTGKDRWALLKEKRAMISRDVPALAKILEDFPLDLAKGLYAVPYALDYVPDAQLRYKPNAASCPGGVVSYVQLADTNLDGKIVYSQRVWDDPAFSELHKAAILLHEQIYFALRETYGDESSYRTRQIMGLIYYITDVPYLQSEVDEVLNSKTRIRPGIFGFNNGPALFNVELKCKIIVNGELLQTWAPLSPADSLQSKFGDFAFYIATSEVDGSPTNLKLAHVQSGVQSELQKDDTVLMFNSVRKASLNLQGSGNSTAQIQCFSKSVLDGDPL